MITGDEPQKGAINLGREPELSRARLREGDRIEYWAIWSWRNTRNKAHRYFPKLYTGIVQHVYTFTGRQSGVLVSREGVLLESGSRILDVVELPYRICMVAY